MDQLLDHFILEKKSDSNLPKMTKYQYILEEILPQFTKGS